jgi:hypothetical protein
LIFGGFWRKFFVVLEDFGGFLEEIIWRSFGGFLEDFWRILEDFGGFLEGVLCNFKTIIFYYIFYTNIFQ